MAKKLIASFALAVLLSLPLWAGGQPPAAPTVQPTGPIGKFNESPMLTARVEANELPAVDQRLPEEPFIMPVQDEIGKHGGQLTVFHRDPNTWAPETLRYVQWGTGILEEISKGELRSTQLDAWLAAGGANLCRRASAELEG